MLKTPICKNMNDVSGTGKWQTKINDLSCSIPSISLNFISTDKISINLAQTLKKNMKFNYNFNKIQVLARIFEI